MHFLLKQLKEHPVLLVSPNHLLDFLYMAVILMSGIELLMEGKVDAIHAVLTVLGGMKIYHEK